MSPLFSLTSDYIKIQLRDLKNKTLYEVRVGGSNYVELFYENWTGYVELEQIPISARLPLHSNKGLFKVRFPRGLLSSDPTGRLKDAEDKSFVQEIEFKWPEK